MIIKRPIVNFEKGRGGFDPVLIVIHIVGLPGKTAESAYQHFNNNTSQVSAHALVLRNGDIWEFVKDEDTSWGAGTVGYKNGIAIPPINNLARNFWQRGVRLNQIALNLEHEGSEYEDLTSAQYASSAQWVREKCLKFHIPIDSAHIDRHSNIRATKTCPGKVNVSEIIRLASLEVPVSEADVIKIKISLLQKILDLLKSLAYYKKLGSTRDDEIGEVGASYTTGFKEEDYKRF